MGDVGYRGISAESDPRYRNKESKLLKQLESKSPFPSSFNQKVDLTKVSLSVFRPWISQRVSELLDFEDDVVVEYTYSLLEEAASSPTTTSSLDPRKMQLSLSGFLEGKTGEFVRELWELLLSAQQSVGGIPGEFVERKKREMKEARERDGGAIRGARRRDGPVTTPSGQRGVDRWAQRQAESGSGGASSRGGGAAREQAGPSRGGNATFKDKSGNVTARSQDSGWGARGPPPPRGDEPRRGDDDHRDRYYGGGPSSSSRRHYDVDEREDRDRYERRRRVEEENRDERRCRRRTTSRSRSPREERYQPRRRYNDDDDDDGPALRRAQEVDDREIREHQSDRNRNRRRRNDDSEEEDSDRYPSSKVRSRRTDHRRRRDVSPSRSPPSPHSPSASPPTRRAR
ncbi:hypothetical protein BDZ90DRAFT_228944 [Jaminaea rosea]|uniref:PWI domain-containing protein n=1 Tax=Jaminaea rosea TaxID=1569628 RepID=A0A316V374_9BASI|nr:hypothetical protein BDZ90DRAFT_228944 [Jaminaea rosea]PWN29895.1 hypothetical protein BDZ90DRAFT_228944 [Jaminaea rosea]